MSGAGPGAAEGATAAGTVTTGISAWELYGGFVPFGAQKCWLFSGALTILPQCTPQAGGGLVLHLSPVYRLRIILPIEKKKKGILM